MLIKREDGNYDCGPLDVICILHDVEKDSYHAALFLESPMPGPLQSIDETKMVRLKSKFHRTEGADSLEGAQAHVTKLREQFIIEDQNVIDDKAVPWDGELGIVWLTENWRAVGDKTAAEVIG